MAQAQRSQSAVQLTSTLAAPSLGYDSCLEDHSSNIKASIRPLTAAYRAASIKHEVGTK